MARKKNPWQAFTDEVLDLVQEMGIEPHERQKLQALKQWSKRCLECAYWSQPPPMPGQKSGEENLAEDYLIISNHLDDYHAK